MLVVIKVISGLIIAYLFGSIPTAYIAGKLLKRIDIRKHGSKNIGATNVFRVLGSGPGIVVLIIDVLKGFLAVVIVSRFLNLDQNIFYILLGLASVCGHNWTLFLNFKGGKGVATSLGVLIGLTVQIVSLRFVLIILILIWMGVFLCFGYVSLASMTAVIFLPLLMLLFTQAIELIMLGIIFCIFILLRHRPNIQRLLEGEETRSISPLFKQ